MKAKFRFWTGRWWCRRMGISGVGDTIQEAWDDMWTQYAQAVRPEGQWYQTCPRA